MITPTEKLIIETFNEVKGNPLISWALVEKTGKNYSYIKQCLWTLQKRGYIKHVKRGKTVFYFPNPDYLIKEE